MKSCEVLFPHLRRVRQAETQLSPEREKHCQSGFLAEMCVQTYLNIFALCAQISHCAHMWIWEACVRYSGFWGGDRFSGTYAWASDCSLCAHLSGGFSALHSIYMVCREAVALRRCNMKRGIVEYTLFVLGCICVCPVFTLVEAIVHSTVHSAQVGYREALRKRRKRKRGIVLPRLSHHLTLPPLRIHTHL